MKENLFRFLWTFPLESKGRYIVGEAVFSKDWVKPVSVAILVNVTEDFKLNNDVEIIDDTNYSFQIRPKAIHMNSKGYYYKLNNSPVYLTDVQIKDMEVYISRAKKEGII